MQADLTPHELLSDEAARLQALHEYQVLDTDAEEDFDDFTALAAHICGTPVALISLIDSDRQWFKSRHGLDARQTPRDVAFCDHAIRQEGVFVVPDASADARFADNPLVTGDTGIQFYAGAPLVTSDGHALGSLCVIDHHPRTLSSEQETALSALSRQVVARLELRRQMAERAKAEEALHVREEALRVSEARKAAILDSALDCIITMDATGRVVEWNPAAATTFGYPASEAVGRDLASLIVPPALRESHRRGLAHYLATGEGAVLGRRIEITAVRADSTELPVELAIRAVPLAGGTLFTATLRDLSERRAAEQALHEQESQYRLLFENATHGIYRTTPDGRILLANPALLSMLGYDSFEQLAARDLEAGGTEAAYERVDFKARLEEAGELRGLEAAWKRRDGRVISVCENARLVRGADGAPLYYEGSVEDVTARKEAEEALREAHDEMERRVAERTAELTEANRALETEMAERQRAEESYRSLFENATEGIFRVTPEGRYLSVNPALARLYGYALPEDLMAGITDTGRQLYVHPECRDEFVVRLQEQDSLTEFEAEVYRRDGSVIWISESARAVRDAEGILLRYEGFVEDITERKRAEEALKESEARYQRIAANVPGMVFQCVIHPDGAMDFPFVSEGCREIYGWEPWQITANPRSIIDIIHPDDRAGFERSIHESITRLTRWDWEGRIVTSAGVKWVKGDANPERQPNGDVISEGLLRDFTERRSTQESLRESEQRYRSLVDHSPEAVIVYAEHRIVYANAAAATLFAAPSAGDLLGRLIFDLVHPDYHALTRERARRSQEEGQPSPLTHHKYLRLDGQAIDVEAVSTGITYRGRRAGQVLIRDVTDRMRAEEQLRASKDMLQLIMDNIPQLIFWKDQSSVYQGCNRNFAQAAGLADPNDVKGLTDYDLPWSEESAEGYRRDDRRIMDCDRPELHFLETQRREDGSESWVETNKVPLHDSHGRVVGILGAYANVTELKRSEQRIRELNAELTQAYDSTIEGWARALDYRDHETEGHSRRVTELTLRLARAVGMEEDELVHVRRGALLHDIGKMGIPDRVLLKPGPLDDDEWAIMRRHPTLAHEMLSPIAFLRDALDIPYGHHEKWDGTGYPRGLAGEAIPLAARLFAVVDVWDALRSDRPYRRAWTVARTLDHVRSLSGTHFDPAAVRVFLAMMAPSVVPEVMSLEMRLAA